MEALSAEYEEEVEEVEEEEEESAEAAESEAALDEQQWSGEEPELDSLQASAEPLEQAEVVEEAQGLDLEPAEAASATAESSMDREEDEAEGEESLETGVSCPLLSLPACYLHCPLYKNARCVKGTHKHFISIIIQVEWQVILPALCCGCKATQACW